ncbi:MAG: endo alpha-1,4 polygalactosaminidase [Gammaproteobacteria bacterium]|nr:endo alpha-1,4 polygalactosaminidase [Gammaproteobacteria bacterium]MCP5136854.1 endo alpha-1,4 polygalactosaminidase [Gammaproteobacteria bacterium]
MSLARTHSALPTRWRRLTLTIWGFAALLITVAEAEPLNHHPWVVYYAAEVPVTVFDPYELVVFDSEAHPPLQGLKERGKTVLGYLSLGEVESHRDWFGEVREAGLLIQENPVWKGSWFVDVRDRRWTKRVIEDLIPRILHRGFDGVFLDTLDNPPHLERTDPKRYARMTEAAARLVRSIRRHYPDITIMQNRGYELLPDVGDSIDAVLGESVFADYDFDKKVYQRVPEDLYREQRAILREAQQQHPKLAIYTLDYWDPADTAGVAAIYAEQRANGFRPYVATIDLDKVVPEPGP